MNEIWEMRQTIHVVALSRLHIRQLARLRLCVVQVDMQHGVIVLVLRAPEVLHAQTLGGNMLSRDILAIDRYANRDLVLGIFQFFDHPLFFTDSKNRRKREAREK